MAEGPIDLPRDAAVDSGVSALRWVGLGVSAIGVFTCSIPIAVAGLALNVADLVTGDARKSTPTQHK